MKYQTKIDWGKLVEDWKRSDPNMTVRQFCFHERVNPATVSGKKLIIDGKPQSVFSKYWRKQYQSNKQMSESTIAQALDNVDVAKDRHYLRALIQGQVLTERIMKQAAKAFDALSKDACEYSSPGEPARIAMAASDANRAICLELQGIPAEGEEFGWPLTKAFWPHPYQRDFIFDLPSTLKATGQDVFLFAFIGGIRSGKTLSAAQKFGDLCWRNRGVPAAIFGPTYRMLEDATKSIFFKVLIEKGISYRYRAADNSVVLFGDTIVRFRSMDNEEHLRGSEYGHVWLDEPGQMPNSDAFRIIMGRMSAAKPPEPCVLVSTTPDGLNWLHDELVLKQAENKVKLYYGSTELNTSLPDGFVDRLRALYDERFYAQEVLGKFLDVFAGAAYWNFDRAASISDEYDYDPGLPIKLCVDFNVDPMCWNVVQQRRYRDGRILDVCVDEMHIRTASTDVACAEFLTRYADHKAGVHIHGDATGHARNTAATRTDYQIIRELLTAKLPAIEIKVGRHNPSVTDSIAAVNARLKNSKGEQSFLLHSRCKMTARDFERVGFVPGTRELDKSQKDLTHHTDAIRYYLFSEYPIRKPTVTIGKAA